MTTAKVGVTLWTAPVEPVARLDRLDMSAPLPDRDEARRRAAALQEANDAQDRRGRLTVSTETLRKLVR